MKIESENTDDNTLAKMALIDKCCNFCGYYYIAKINKIEYHCCGCIETINDDILKFYEDGFENSTRVYFSCKYFTEREQSFVTQSINGTMALNLNPNYKNKIYDTSISIDDINDIPGYDLALKINRTAINNKKLKEAEAIYTKNTDEVARLLVDKKIANVDAQIDNIGELAQIAKIADNIDISEFTEKYLHKEEHNPYE